MQGLLFIFLFCMGTSIYLIIKAISTRTLIKMLTGTILFAISMSFGHALVLDMYSLPKPTVSTMAVVNQSSPSSSSISCDVHK